MTPGTVTAPTTWRPGAVYFYALRGGTSGIKTTTGIPLQPSSTTYTLIFGQGSDFNCPSTSPNCSLKSLQALQAQYQPVFGVIQSQGFPLGETVVVGTFSVAPATTWVVADPGAGVVPIPSNFLLDPLTNKVSAAVDQLVGLPMSSLDGFSTTGMDTAQTSGPISAGQRPELDRQGGLPLQGGGHLGLRGADGLLPAAAHHPRPEHRAALRPGERPG